MQNQIPSSFSLSREISLALKNGTPIVALESAVITHGLPQPQNFELACELQNQIRAAGVTPATIAMLDGKLHVGLDEDQLRTLSAEKNAIKLSTRSIGIGLSGQKAGGTTVAATLFAARTVGIKVFATGGIGGVHRGTIFDISADLDELAKSPVVVICAGAKAILDLPATLEALETRGVPVLGFQTDEFPAFYSHSSGLAVDMRVESADQIASIAHAHWNSGLNAAILVGLPPSKEFALDNHEIEKSIQAAIHEAEQQHIYGAKLTPFLLDRVSKLSEGKSLAANLDLLKNNARLAAEVAVALANSLNRIL